jgi:hypothetical protein
MLASDNGIVLDRPDVTGHIAGTSQCDLPTCQGGPRETFRRRLNQQRQKYLRKVDGEMVHDEYAIGVEWLIAVMHAPWND